MIYMVEHTIGMPELEAEWSQWCTAYLERLIAVPGIRAIQRFRSPGTARYLSMHTVESAAVFDSAAYKASGGGGQASVRFRPAYQAWRRNLFDVAHAAPLVGQDEVLLVLDGESPGDPAFAWMQSTGLDRSVAWRGLAVAAAAESSARAGAHPGCVLYAPIAGPFTK